MKNSLSVSLEDAENVYDGQEHLPTIKSLRDSSGRDLRDKLISSISFSFSKDGAAVDSPTEAGVYSFTIILKDDEYVIANPGPYTLVIGQAEIPVSTYIEPKPESQSPLPYEPAGWDLVREGTGVWVGPEYGTFYYMTEFTPAAKTVPEGYTPNRPVGKDAGIYKVYWHMESVDPNYADRDGAFAIRILAGELEKVELSFDGSAGIVAPEYFNVSYKGHPLDKINYELRIEENSNNRWDVSLQGKGNLEPGEIRYRLILDEETGTYTLTRINPKEQPYHMEFHRLGNLWDQYTNCPAFGCGRELPATGFPTRVTRPLSVRPEDLQYRDMKMRLQIPTLNVDTELIGVPEKGGVWAVEWIGDKAGLLSGTSRPGEGYSLIAGHNHLDNSQTGPFLTLGSLNTDDRIFINTADGGLLTFRVYANELLKPTDMEKMAGIAKQEADALILITCENESSEGGYLNRRAVFAAPL